MNASERLDAYRRRLIDEGADAGLVSSVANMRYLTGFDRVFDDHINAAAVVTSRSAYFYTDARYIEAAEAAARGTCWTVTRQRESLFMEICADLRDRGIQTLAMESNAPYSRFRFISEQFEGRVLVTDQLVEELRAVKEPAEIEAIARAAALTDRALDHVLGTLKPGMREIDVSLALEVYMRSNGSEGLAFDPIVASGPNSSKPHASVTERAIEAGDLLTMDFGARVDGYCADLTRTVVVGARATDEQRRDLRGRARGERGGAGGRAAGRRVLATSTAWARAVLAEARPRRGVRPRHRPRRRARRSTSCPSSVRAAERRARRRQRHHDRAGRLRAGFRRC